jgi:hypothetical protein
MEAPVDRPVILAQFGIRKRLALYDLIGNKKEAEREIWIFKHPMRHRNHALINGPHLAF